MAELPSQAIQSSPLYASRKHPPDAYQKAVDLSKQGVSLRRISRETGIPKETARRFLLGDANARPGPKAALSASEEETLVLFLKYMERLGHPRSKQEILDLVKEIVSDGRDHKFVDHRPGDKWWRGFLSRHQELRLKYAEGISHRRANNATKEVIDTFFERYTTLVETENYLEIWNADEKPVCLDGRSRSLVLVTHKALPFVRQGDARDHVTVLLCVERSGKGMTPTFIYPGQRLPACFVRDSGNAAFSMTENGYSTSSSKYEWLRDIFLPRLQPSNPQSPRKSVRSKGWGALSRCFVPFFLSPFSKKKRGVFTLVCRH